MWITRSGLLGTPGDWGFNTIHDQSDHGPLESSYQCVRWAGLPAVELDSNRVLDELVVFEPLRNIIITCFWIVYVV